MTNTNNTGTTWAAGGLLPDLPMTTYASTEAWNPERIGAMTMYCCDGRWGEAFDEFCQKSLDIPRYDRFAVPGGPAWLVRQETKLREAHHVAREQIAFLVRVHELERIVLITHFGCAFYGELLRMEPEAMLGIQLDDLRLAIDRVSEWFPQVTAEGYLAMREGNSLTFRRIQT